MARRRTIRITSLLAFGGVVVWWWWRGRSTVGMHAAASAEPVPVSSPAPPPSWVEPIEGVCPPGYPVKLNLQSGIFHVPGGRFYDRTVPARCYASADAAEADGYRRAKA